MMVDFGAEMAKPHSKDFSHLINVGVGKGNSEVISMGVGEKVFGLGDCGGKAVE